MANNTSLVTQITGQAWVRDAEGSLAPIYAGMHIPADADVVTSSGASVQLASNGQPPVQIGENRDVQIGPEVAEPDVDPSTAAATQPEPTDADQVLSALDAGEDPFDDLDPTAAVIEGGSDGAGGSSFTRLLSIVELTTPLALEYPRPTYPKVEEIRLGGTGSNQAPELTGGAAGLMDQVNDDSDTIEGLDVGQYFSDPDGHSLTFSATGLPPGLTLNPITGVIQGQLDSSASQGGPAGNGIYTVVITATDPYGASVNLPFTWTTHNPPPIAADDFATTEENTVVEGNVLTGDPDTGEGRDVDPDGDELTVVEITNSTGDKVPAGTPIVGVNADGDKGGGSFTINPDGSYTFEPGTDFDYLAVGEETTTKVTYKISDGDGGFDEATLTITVTGSNDAPVITPVEGDNAEATITEVEDRHPDENVITHKKEGTITFEDADDSDTHTITTTPRLVEGKPPFLGQLVTVLNPDKTIDWTFEVDDKDIDHLAKDETLVQEYVVTVDDGQGGTVEQTITITIIGTNDAPVIDVEESDVAGAVTEDDADNASTSGTLVWDDADTTDTHTWTVVDGKGPEYGRLTINNKGEWEYTLDNSNEAVDRLPEDGKLTDTITVLVDDGNGGTAEQIVTITITGTNDVPVINEQETQATGTVKESGYQEEGTLEVSGTLVATDVDDGDELTWSFDSTDEATPTLTQTGEYGSIALNPETGEWTYTLDDDALITEQLNDGDTRKEIFTAYVSDGNGGIVEQKITVTVEGTNDAPVANPDVNQVTEAGVGEGNDPNAPVDGKAQAKGNVLTGAVEGVVDESAKDTDIDNDAADLKVTSVTINGQTHQFGTAASITVTTPYGELIIDTNGDYVYNLDNDASDVQELRPEDTVVQEFTYTISDGSAPGESSLTITIHGTNDRPEITAASELTGEVTEQGHNNPDAKSVISGQLEADDVDAQDGELIWSVRDGVDSVNSVRGTYGTLTLDEATGKWTYELDNDDPATQALTEGQKVNEEFTVRVTDGYGAWQEKTVTVGVTGSNDAPVANDDVITFNEDLIDETEGVSDDGKSKIGNVLENDTNPEGPLTVISFKVNGQTYTIDSNPESPTSIEITGVGQFSMNAKGDYVFTPKEHYSGEVPDIEYTIQEGGTDSGEASLTDDATLKFKITPVADTPELIQPADVVTDEDEAIHLGLIAPDVVDNVDHNGAGFGDNPELLGPITVEGIPAGTTIIGLIDPTTGLDYVSDGSPIQVVITDRAEHGHINGAKDEDGVFNLTKDEFEALQILPKKDDATNFDVTVTVTSYEVDNQGNPLSGIPGADTSVTVPVDVQAVTDDVDLKIETGDGTDEFGGKGIFTIDEDTTINLKDVLKAEFEDLDGSEDRWITIENTTGEDILVNGQTLAAGKVLVISQEDLSTSTEGFGDIKIGGTKDFSGDLKGIKVTLHAKDTDADSTHTTVEETSEVTLDLHVNPVAGDVSVPDVVGYEDTSIYFLKDAGLTDKDGSERITGFTVKGIPEGWVLTNHLGQPVTLTPMLDGNDDVIGYKYTFGKADVAGDSPNFNDWTLTPPLHSSEDATLQIEVSTRDEKVVDGVTVVDTDTDTHDLKVTVKPVAEIIATDNENQSGSDDGDLRITEGHDYQDAANGKEDGWFELNTNGFDLSDRWHNADGKPAKGEENTESADGGTEETWALLTPDLVDGVEGESAVGSKFSYMGPDGEVILTYNGTDAVEIPMEYLDTVKFMGPPHVSGKFDIKVQAKTVDTDFDGGYTDTAISGEAWLKGIVIDPVADPVTLGIGGAHGKEDTEIPLIIRPSSADPSETFTVEISDIPQGATLKYKGVEVELVAGDDGTTFKATIENFDNSAKLTITPPPNSNEDFPLTVKAHSVDSMGGVTDTSDIKEETIQVRVDGVADGVDVVFQDVRITEANLDGGDNTIALSDIVDIENTKMQDADGSETLTFKITGLPDDFSVEGALFMGGEGTDREWTFTADQLANIKIKVPEHYSGKLPGQLIAVTTENDGDSKTSEAHEWGVTITPSPESEMVSTTTVNEDTLTQLDFQTDTSHGDTNEVLTTVWIKAADIDGKDFTLFLGQDGPTLADAATGADNNSVTLDDGYYKLTGDGVNNVFVKPGPNFSGDLSFDVQYEVTDYAEDGSNLSASSGMIEGQHTITVRPVTDPVELELTPPSVGQIETAGDVKVGITLNKATDADAGGARDHDGSEQFTQVTIDGVPEGMLVSGITVGGSTIGDVSYLGDGKWLISIPEADYPKFDDTNEDEDGSISGEITFVVGDHVSNGEQAIKITVVTQDDGSDVTTSDTQDWNFTVALADGSGDGDDSSVTATWEQNDDFVGVEDTSFKLGDLFTGELAQNDAAGDPVDRAPNTSFSIVLNLSPGSTVTDSFGNNIEPTIIDGQETWVLTGKGQNQLDDYLRDITVTPPLNLNDNADDKFQVDVNFTAHLENGKRSEAGFGKGDDDYVSLTPVTDPAVIEVDFKAIDADGNPTNNNPQEGSDVAISINVTSPNDGPTALGDKLYIKLTEDVGLQVGGKQGGTLKNADGSVLIVESIGADNDLDLAQGDYYVIDLPEGATAPHSLDLIYTPHDDKAFTDGSLTLDVTVQNNEAGDVNADGNPNWNTSSGSAIGNLEAINNGYDLGIGHQSDDGWVDNVVIGKENQENEPSSAIHLGIKDNGLIDNDGSEQAISAMLKGVPNGFLVYVKDGDDRVLAGNAGGTDGNTWMIPLTENGTLPEIFVMPPQNWSGTVSGLELNVLSGEIGKETWGNPNIFDLVVDPVADGILSFNPAPAFGKEGDIIQLNLNIVMKDDQKAGDTDESVETITVMLEGLGKHAAFYVDGDLFDMTSDRLHYDEEKDVYTLSGLSQEDADKLGFIQAAGAAQDKVAVTVETVESGNGDTSDPSDSKAFDLSIFDQLPSSGDDTLLYGGDLLDGGQGDDTVWLRFGEDLVFGDEDVPVKLKNIEILDLTKEGYDHSLINLGADDVLGMTDSRNVLTINADDGDEISLKDDNWMRDGDKSTDDYDVYIGQSNGQDVEVHVTKDFAVSGELLDDPDTQSIDGLLGEDSTNDGGVTGASVFADNSTDQDGQSQLINDLIQQGKLTADI